MEGNPALEKNTVEFVTVAAEYCVFIGNSGDKDRIELIDILSKLLPLLYLKASMMPEMEPEGLFLEENVTETEYDTVRSDLRAVMSDADDYLEVFVEDMKYSDTPVRKSVSEDLADIYQALKNFIASYRSGLEEVMTEAVAVCSEGFRTYWGQTLANTLRAVHCIKYSPADEHDTYFSSPDRYL